MNLAAKACFACEAGTPPLPHQQIITYQKQINSAWKLKKDHEIKREFKFKDFKQAMNFVNSVADIANSEGHHPDIYIFYNIVRLKLYTHAVKGLSENDFIMAAKIDQLNHS